MPAQRICTCQPDGKDCSIHHRDMIAARANFLRAWELWLRGSPCREAMELERDGTHRMVDAISILYGECHE